MLNWEDAMHFFSLFRTVTLGRSRNSWFAPCCQLARSRASSLQPGRSAQVPAGLRQPGAGPSAARDRPSRHCGLSGWKNIASFWLEFLTCSLNLGTVSISITSQSCVQRNSTQGNNSGIFKIKVNEESSVWMEFQLRWNNLIYRMKFNRVLHNRFLFQEESAYCFRSLSPSFILLG